MTATALTTAPPPPAPPTKTALATAEDLVFPVGFDLGRYHRAPGEPLAYYEVCAGQSCYALPGEDDYRAWTAAHTPGERPPLTWPEYSARMFKTGIEDVNTVVGRLGDSGLLWRVPPSGPDAAAFARVHRLLPLATAIGNVDAPADTYILGLPGGVHHHHATELEYWMWLWGVRWDNLWEVCETLAARPTARTGLATDPLSCVTPVLLAAQELVVHSVAFLDTAWARD
jgi:hypothetical protein